LYKYLDRFTPFGILGYELHGEPSGIDVQDSWLALVGSNFRVSPLLSVGLDIYFHEALFSGVDDQKELTAFFRYKLSKTQYLRGYLIQGFGEGSPDWGVGVLITFRQ
jgi:hypothetical protein